MTREHLGRAFSIRGACLVTDWSGWLCNLHEMSRDTYSALFLSHEVYIERLVVYPV